jgi:hypothetical protein
MTITITATAGDAAANSFVTEAEAIAYMAGRLNASAWTTLSGSTCTETEKQALIEATLELTVLGYRGARVGTTQALAWPRDWAVNPDDPTGQFYANTVIPDRVKQATCELAFQFLKAGTTDVAALDSLQGIRQKTVDVLTTVYEPGYRPRGIARYPRVINYLRPLLEGSSLMIPLERG